MMVSENIFVCGYKSLIFVYSIVESNIASTTDLYTSIWSYIDDRNEKNAIFYNFEYAAAIVDERRVLRPKCNIAALRLWTFYSEDYLAHGSSYDLGMYDMIIVIYFHVFCLFRCSGSGIGRTSTRRIAR